MKARYVICTSTIIIIIIDIILTLKTENLIPGIMTLKELNTASFHPFTHRNEFERLFNPRKSL